ncbi:MAG: carbonic anhydrase [Arcobacteraceae bacterium]|jgi:carbonic anhydrase
MKKLQQLIQGHQEFQKLHHKQFAFEFDELVKKGQSPEILFIGCSDSRVVPDLITGSKPGDLFIIRNVGNFVPPFREDNDFHGTAAGIEYAVSVLGIKHIIVCGHSHCGACESLYHEIPEKKELVHVKKWLELGNISKSFVEENFKTETKTEKIRLTEQVSVVFQLENLLTYPAVAKGIEDGTITIHGWYYDLQTGVIKHFDTDTFEFKDLISQK